MTIFPSIVRGSNSLTCISCHGLFTTTGNLFIFSTFRVVLSSGLVQPKMICYLVENGNVIEWSISGFILVSHTIYLTSFQQWRRRWVRRSCWDSSPRWTGRGTLEGWLRLFLSTPGLLPRFRAGPSPRISSKLSLATFPSTFLLWAIDRLVLFSTKSLNFH